MNYKLKKVELSGYNIIRSGEERDLIIKLEKENRAAIHGVVRFPNGRPARNAIVKLFLKKHNHCDLVPITFTFTDECGQFLFGVDCGRNYVIKVFFYNSERKTTPYNYKDKITKPVDKEEITVHKGKEENYYNKGERYREADICYIDVTNTKGQQKKLNDNESLVAKEQDILELDIVITPPIT